MAGLGGDRRNRRDKRGISVTLLMLLVHLLVHPKRLLPCAGTLPHIYLAIKHVSTIQLTLCAWKTTACTSSHALTQDRISSVYALNSPLIHIVVDSQS
jgi:hypothetical protein